MSPPTTPQPFPPSSAAPWAQRLALGILMLLAAVEMGLIGRVILRPPTQRDQDIMAAARPTTTKTTPPAPVAARAAQPQPTASPPKASAPSARDPEPRTPTQPPVAAKPATLWPPVVPLRISPPPVGQLASSPATPSAGPAASRLSPPEIGSLELPKSTTENATRFRPAQLPPAIPANSPNMSSPTPAVINASAALQKPSGAAGIATKVANPPQSSALESALQQARALSGQGDMQGCLDLLKRAQQQFPAKPQLLAELARTYETMDLRDKATAVWKQLAAMPPTQAGSFAELANRRIGETMNANQTGASAADRVLSLGACRSTELQPSLSGQRVTLDIPILRRGNARIDPSKVDLDILFFERVNGEKISQSIADKPETIWQQLPVDWTESGEETLQVQYFLPAMTPTEIEANGRRHYHGYVLRLYYDNRIQDSLAKPGDLLHLSAPSTAQPRAAEQGLNPLLPPLSNPPAQ